MDEKVIHALIPARSGSKGITNKNIILYNGVPLMVHSIKQAIGCKYISRVIVSTDSKKYRDIAIEAGAEVPFLRPPELSGDTNRDYDFFIHYISHLKSIDSPLPDIIVQFRPTTPTRDENTIEDTIRTFLNPMIYNNYHSLRTVVPVKKSPYKMYNIVPYMDNRNQSNNINNNINNIKNEPRLLNLKPLFGHLIHPNNTSIIYEPYNAPRQLLPNCYLHDGYIDIVKTDTLINRQSVSGDKIYPYVRNIDEEQIEDIDTYSDLKNATKSSSISENNYPNKDDIDIGNDNTMDQVLDNTGIMAIGFRLNK